MKVLKRILLVLVLIIAILLIVGLFTAKSYSVQREITINKPKQEVYDYLRILDNQKYYNVWVMADTNAKSTKTGTDGTVGFVTAWESDRDSVGKGEQEIKSLKEGEKINLEIRFIEPFEGLARVETTTDSVAENQTRVKQHFSGEMQYPTNLMLLFMNMDKNLGGSMAKSLENLKKQLEK